MAEDYKDLSRALNITFREYPKLATNGSQFGRSAAQPGTRCYRLGLGFVIAKRCGMDAA
jgi:hypothetical protein